MTLSRFKVPTVEGKLSKTATKPSRERGRERKRQIAVPPYRSIVRRSQSRLRRAVNRDLHATPPFASLTNNTTHHDGLSVLSSPPPLQSFPLSPFLLISSLASVFPVFPRIVPERPTPLGLINRRKNLDFILLDNSLLQHTDASGKLSASAYIFQPASPTAGEAVKQPFSYGSQHRPSLEMQPLNTSPAKSGHRHGGIRCCR